MFNYMLKIEYVGSNFVGWQIQKNGVSIQQKIEKSLYKILRKKLKLSAPDALIKEFMREHSMLILR